VSSTPQIAKDQPYNPNALFSFPTFGQLASSGSRRVAPNRVCGFPKKGSPRGIQEAVHTMQANPEQSPNLRATQCVKLEEYEDQSLTPCKLVQDPIHALTFRRVVDRVT
jgi:hypothetical protein